MKINNIYIDGYKNLINCNYGMNDFNVIIGANNSGKSNFLEIITFLNILLNGSEDLKELLYKGVLEGTSILSHFKSDREGVISLRIEMSDNVQGEEYKYIYSINTCISNPVEVNENKNGILEEGFEYKKASATGPMKVAFKRNGKSIIKINGPKINNIDSKEPLISLINKIPDIKNKFDESIQVGINNIFLISKTPILYSVPDYIRESLKVNQGFYVKRGRVVALSLTDEIIKTLKSSNKQYYEEILEDVLGIVEVTPIEFSQDMRFVKVQFKNHQEVAINELSDGTLIALNIITYLVSNKFPVIAIEELENSIHPRLLKKLISLIRNSFEDVQVIVTTHSPILLNMVKINEVSIMNNKLNGEAFIEQVKEKKELLKKLSGPFSSFGDIFEYIED